MVPYPAEPLSLNEGDLSRLSAVGVSTGVLRKHRLKQCSGSMTFWGVSGSGSSDPCFWLMDPDPGSGSCYFRHWPSRCLQKLIFNNIFSAYYFLKVHLHHFCMMIEGSGSGSIPLTSGSGWPKNMWIRWIRIRNTGLNIEVDLQSLFGLHVTWCAQLYSLAETPQPPPMPPHLDSVLRGRYWSAKIDDISL